MANNSLQELQELLGLYDKNKETPVMVSQDSIPTSIQPYNSAPSSEIFPPIATSTIEAPAPKINMSALFSPNKNNAVDTEKLKNEISELDTNYTDQLKKAQSLDNLFNALDVASSGLGKIDAGRISQRSGTNVTPVEASKMATEFAKQEEALLKPQLEKKSKLLEQYKELTKPKETKYMQIGNTLVKVNPNGTVESKTFEDVKANYQTVKSPDGSVWQVNAKNPSDRTQLFPASVDPAEQRREKTDIKKDVKDFRKDIKDSQNLLNQVEQIEKTYGFDLDTYDFEKNKATINGKDKKVDIPGVTLPGLGQIAPFGKAAEVRNTEQSIYNRMIKELSGGNVTGSEEIRNLIDQGRGPLSTEAQRIESLKKVKQKLRENITDAYTFLDEDTKKYMDSQKMTPPVIKNDEMVSVINKEGKPGKIPRKNLEKALSQGYKEVK